MSVVNMLLLQKTLLKIMLPVGAVGRGCCSFGSVADAVRVLVLLVLVLCMSSYADTACFADMYLMLLGQKS